MTDTDLAAVVARVRTEARMPTNGLQNVSRRDALALCDAVERLQGELATERAERDEGDSLAIIDQLRLERDEARRVARGLEE